MDLAVYMAVAHLMMAPPGGTEVISFLTEVGCVIDVNESGTTIVKKSGKHFSLFRSAIPDAGGPVIIGELSSEYPNHSGLKPVSFVEIPRVKEGDPCPWKRPVFP